MHSRFVVTIARWTASLLVLAAIVFVYRRWLTVNPTTVALTLLLFILVLAARLSLRYAVILSLLSAACYNFFFLPPIGTFTIHDPQNWVALIAFLVTGVIGSRLSQRARDDADDARRNQREVEVLFTLSRELLQTENVAELLNSLPPLIYKVSKADSVVLYLLEGDRLYQAGVAQITNIELPHLRQLSLSLSTPETDVGNETRIPLRAGVRPRGLLLLRGVRLSAQSFQAIGGLVSIALDRAQALATVARSEAAKESERLRTLILDSITHELRTPLDSIRTAAASLLAEGDTTAGDRVDRLHLITNESDRLNKLVEEAIEMAQLEAQEIHIHYASVAIADLVEHATSTCGAIAATHPITVRLPPLPTVSADPEMIGKVLSNLLENAARYSNPGSPIFITAELQGRFVLTNVADRGFGIDTEEQSLVFDRLYRSRRQSGATYGTGMGLSISRSIVEAHHGHLTLTSQPGHGSVFTFSLPIAE